jgi:peptidyl-prolyl cis-trans isomerase C
MNKPFKVFHILVKHEYEAQDVIKKLHEGMSFAQAATKFSSCSSARDGGALGPYKPGRFVEAFDEAVTEMPMDTISPPIRTQFGYHVILKK